MHDLTRRATSAPEPTETSAPASPGTITVGPEHFINRELSWLDFNERVLDEAFNEANPLLERLRFLAISGSNLDEFYMVRVSGLAELALLDLEADTPDGLSPKRVLEAIRERVAQVMQTQQRAWQQIKKALATSGIEIVDITDLSADERARIEQIFLDQALPVLTPIAIDPAHPFPFISNKGMGIILELGRPGGENLNGLVLLPPQIDRFFRLSQEDQAVTKFVRSEQVIEHFVNLLFPGFEVQSSGQFRVIRDSDVEVEEEAEDLVRLFETLLQRRKRGSVIRLSITESTPLSVRQFLISQTGAHTADNFIVEDLVGIADVAQLIGMCKERGDLVFPPFSPRFPERIKEFDYDCLAAIRHKDFVVHHPYESFDVVVQFLRQAARDPAVVAIKQTLYRTSEDSPIVAALNEAAENGKSVTALVELKARFDEASNIRWARDLERNGVQVVYGFINFKTHAKVSMVVRREKGGLRTYCHFGTGNYHPITARFYTDLSFFTCDPELARDAAKAFNYMTGYAEPRDLAKLALAPVNLKETLFAHIDREIAHARAGRKAAIWAKMNALVFGPLITRLYEASQAGVQIDLVVRGICCLKPGIPGLSETIRVRSLVGRFLEHSRIVCFGNGGGLPSKDAKVFISSADWMPRNLLRRVESLVPIENPTVHEQILNQVMIANLKDTSNCWLLQPDGRWKRSPKPAEPFSAHDYFMTNPSLSGRGSALKRGHVLALELPADA